MTIRLRVVTSGLVRRGDHVCPFRKDSGTFWKRLRPHCYFGETGTLFGFDRVATIHCPTVFGSIPDGCPLKTDVVMVTEKKHG